MQTETPTGQIETTIHAQAKAAQRADLWAQIDDPAASVCDVMSAMYALIELNHKAQGRVARPAPLSAADFDRQLAIAQADLSQLAPLAPVDNPERYRSTCTAPARHLFAPSDVRTIEIIAA
jgi:hypothetical protein